MKVVALIPARGGSKEIPKKNITLLNGKPLLHYTLETALKSVWIKDIWVSTDDEEIKKAALNLPDIKVWDRPVELAQDNSSTESVAQEFAEHVAFDVLVLLQCTSPLLSVHHLDKGIEQVMAGRYDSSFSVARVKQWLWKGHEQNKLYPAQGYQINQIKDRAMRQNISTMLVHKVETGAFYITTRKAFEQSGCRISGWIGTVEVPFWQSFEVDSYEDLKNIERLLK